MIDSTLEVQVRNLDEKFKLLMDEAEKRNGQRFDAQQEAVATAMVAQEKAVLAAMAAAEKAVAKAEIASDKRFESVNEFRKTLSDQTAGFITRGEFTVQFKAFSEKLDIASSKIAELDKKLGEIRERGAGRNDTWVYITGGIILLITVITFGFLLVKPN